MSDNEWQRVITNDNEWHQMTGKGATNENEWQQIKLSDFKFQNEKEVNLIPQFYSIFYAICNYYIFSNNDNL